MLNKFEIHFGEEILYVPQIRMLGSIMFAGHGKTLKENIIEAYKDRTAREKEKRTGEELRSYDMTTEEIEEQIIKDLQEEGNDFVFEKAWLFAYIDLYGDGTYCDYNLIGMDEVEFKGVVEDNEKS